MSTEIKGKTMSFLPAVRLQDKDGSKFVGKLVGSKTSKFGLEFTFAVVGGDANTAIRENKQWKEVEVKIGENVTVLTSKDGQLESKLSEVKDGQTATIVFLGKKLNPKSGRYYNDFQVFVD